MEWTYSAKRQTDRQTDRHGMDLLCQKRERERERQRQRQRQTDRQTETKLEVRGWEQEEVVDF